MKEIEIKSLDELECGDIVRGKLSGESYVVTSNYSQYVIGVRSVQISQPNEWVKIEK